MENMLCPKQLGSLFIGPGGIIVSNFALINGPEISEYFMNSIHRTSRKSRGTQTGPIGPALDPDLIPRRISR